jgi:hypothetical protein
MHARWPVPRTICCSGRRTVWQKSRLESRGASDLVKQSSAVTRAGRRARKAAIALQLAERDLFDLVALAFLQDEVRALARGQDILMQI